MHDLRPAQLIRCGVVGSVGEDDMDETHPYEQRDDTVEHDLVLAEQSFCPYPSSEHANEDRCEGEDGTPP